MDPMIWFVVFIAFLGFELVTMGLTSIWLAIGALAAFIASMFDVPVAIQVIIFAIVSTVVLFFLRPFALKYVNNKTEKTNVDAMEGKTGKVTTEINNIEGKGEILVDGKYWSARTRDDSVIPEDTLVTVVRVEGVKAIVKKEK